MKMQFRAVFFSVMLLFPSVVSAQAAAADAPSSQQLAAENTSSIDDKTTSIIIRTNVSSAEVYINSVYQGPAPCTINNLAPGTYKLTVSKAGYDSRSYTITVRNGEKCTFFIELEKITGFIIITGAPAGSAVYTDGMQVSSSDSSLIVAPLELPEGYHSITVRKFGYQDFTSQVYVLRRVIVPVQIQMTEADFSLSSFSASRRRFNPAYNGSIGSCTFTFTVTAPESGTLTIADEHGTEVFSYKFPQFATWSQQASWNGRDAYGRLLPDGTYAAQITAGGFTQTAYTRIDHTLTYHPADITKSGSGIGTLPAAFTAAEDTTSAGIEVSPSFRTNETPFYDAPVNFMIGMAPASWLEFVIHAGVHTGLDDGPLSLSGALKLSSSKQAGDGIKFCYAGILRYGCTSKVPLFPPYGADTGNGLGGGAAAGFEAETFYAGISSEFVYGALQGNLKQNDSVWRNGMAAEYRPSHSTTLKAWCALNSSWGDTTGSVPFRALDTGAGTSLQLGDSPVVLNIRADALVFFGSTSYFSGTAGLTYLF